MVPFTFSIIALDIVFAVALFFITETMLAPWTGTDSFIDCKSVSTVEWRDNLLAVSILVFPVIKETALFVSLASTKSTFTIPPTAIATCLASRTAWLDEFELTSTFSALTVESLICDKVSEEFSYMSEPPETCAPDASTFKFAIFTLALDVALVDTLPFVLSTLPPVISATVLFASWTSLMPTLNEPSPPTSL